jgi:predicted nucleotidyltransferase
MTRTDIVNKLRVDTVAFGVRRLALFGSVARGEDAPGNDMDFLVAFDGPMTFDRYFDLKFWLEDLFGQPVDLITESALRSEMATEVHREALHVAP